MPGGFIRNFRWKICGSFADGFLEHDARACELKAQLNHAP